MRWIIALLVMMLVLGACGKVADSQPSDTDITDDLNEADALEQDLDIDGLDDINVDVDESTFS